MVQFLATEMFKVYERSAPNILNEIFALNAKSSYSLRSQQTFATRPIHTVHFWSNSLNYLSPNIWEMVPSDIKNLGIVKAFKFSIKRGATRNLPL